MPSFDIFSSYMNARVRGMKSALLSRVELNAFLHQADVGAMTESLLSSPYEVELAESMTRYQGADAIEDATARNLVANFAQLQRVSRGRRADLIQLFLTRWDLATVKSLLRARHHQLDISTAEEMLFPAPGMPIAVLRELAAQDTMEDLIHGLSGWNAALCGKLVKALGKYQEENDLRVLEEVLDRAYFVDNVQRLGTAKDANSRFVLSLLRMEIDRINLRILLAPRPEGTRPEDVLRRVLPQGTLRGPRLREIAASPSPDRVLEQLSGTAYSSFAEGVVSFMESGKFSRLERMFESVILAHLKRVAQQQGLGVAVLMHYAWLKYNEIMNLRMIARGISVGLPQARIEEEIVHV